jgi:ubiquinone/menaquinone biosynthesis C-methylase UbiE
LNTNIFNSHWNDYSSQTLPITKKIEAQRFLQPLFATMESQVSLRVLDAGCGDGVHIEVIADNCKASERVSLWRVDISLTALCTSRRRQRNEWSFVQGDVSQLPFQNGQFEVVFSFGVLCYKDNPLLSFSELCRVTRKGGFIGIYVYPRPRGIKGFLFRLVRKACQIGGHICCQLIVACIVPFLGFLPTRSKMKLTNSSWRQCRELVMVNIAPKQLYFPDAFEVEGWFARHNVKIISTDNANPLTYWGEKC